jgi:hypothetical protein
MADLQDRLDDLRYQIENLNDSATASDVSALEAEARALMSAAKNTEFEDEAKALFTALARRSAPGAARSETSSEVRGLLRRARIRLDVANDDHDIDEAIDILAEALSLDPDNGETLGLLNQAASRGAQHAMKVQGLVERHGIDMDTPPPTSAPAYVEAQSRPCPPRAIHLRRCRRRITPGTINARWNWQTAYYPTTRITPKQRITVKNPKTISCAASSLTIASPSTRG